MLKRTIYFELYQLQVRRLVRGFDPEPAVLPVQLHVPRAAHADAARVNRGSRELELLQRNRAPIAEGNGREKESKPISHSLRKRNGR